MLVLSRSVGQSLIFGGDQVLTLSRIDPGLASVTLRHLSSTEDVSALTLREGESADVFPDVRVTIVRLFADRPSARLGVDLPRDIPVYRKEIFDAIHGGDPGDELGGVVGRLNPKPPSGSSSAFRTPPSASD